MKNQNQDFWQGRSVLVTGASGLLGGWLVQELLRRESSVVALIRDGSPNSMFYRQGMVEDTVTVRGSLEDMALLKRIMAEYSVDTIFHLAAQTLVGVAKKDPVGTLEANVRGSWNLLEAARQCDVKQIVVASSDKAYGASTQLPYVETHPLNGTFPYDVSKSCVDLISSMYAATYGLPVAVARCGNIFGGGDLNFSRTVPGVIQSTLRDERFLIRSDGKYVRDFLYVEDAVEAYLSLAERLAENRSLIGQAFNFSLEVRFTVLDLVHTILRLMDAAHLEPIVQNSATAEIREQYMISDRARRQLNWSPHFGMDEGLKRTIAWYRAFFAVEKETRELSSTVAV